MSKTCDECGKTYAANRAQCPRCHPEADTRVTWQPTEAIRVCPHKVVKSDGEIRKELGDLSAKVVADPNAKPF